MYVIEKTGSRTVVRVVEASNLRERLKYLGRQSVLRIREL